MPQQSQRTSIQSDEYNLRNLAFVIDSNGYRWARLMHKLLREICHAVNQSETGVLSEVKCRRYRKRYRTILTQGGKEFPEIPRRREEKRGRVARSFGHNLHDRLLKYEDSVLRFMSDPDVSFTPMTRLSKKSGCQRSRSMSRGASGQNATPTLDAGYRVISIQWQNSDTIHSKPFLSRLTEMPLT